LNEEVVWVCPECGAKFVPTRIDEITKEDVKKFVKRHAKTHLKDLKVGETVNVECVVLSISEIYEFTQRNGAKGRVRNMWVEELTTKRKVKFWNKMVELTDGIKKGSSVLLKNFKVVEEEGKDGNVYVALQATSESEIEVLG